LTKIKSLTTAVVEVARFNICGSGIYVAEAAIGLSGLAELANVLEHLCDTQAIKFRTVRETEMHKVF
jgi:hypothetical protein